MDMMGEADTVKTPEAGFGLIEVMFAMVILAFAILGVMGTFQWADHGVQYGRQGTVALAMAQARLETKITAPWNRLLLDDLDGDGVPDLTMQDDGHHPDAAAGDGIYSASSEISGVQLVWTLKAEPNGTVAEAGAVIIQVRASYLVGRWGRKHLHLGTLRANPNYSGR